MRDPSQVGRRRGARAGRPAKWRLLPPVPSSGAVKGALLSVMCRQSTRCWLPCSLLCAGGGPPAGSRILQALHRRKQGGRRECFALKIAGVASTGPPASSAVVAPAAPVAPPAAPCGAPCCQAAVPVSPRLRCGWHQTCCQMYCCRLCLAAGVHPARQEPAGRASLGAPFHPAAASAPHAQVFTLREKSQLDVYGTWAVLRTQLATTDDSFAFNKARARC